MQDPQRLANKIPNKLTRKKFIQSLAGLNLILVSSLLFRNNLFGRNFPYFDLPEETVDKKMQFNVAIARALTHRPPDKYAQAFQNGDEYEIRRTAALTLLTNKAYLASDFSFPEGAFSNLVLNIDPEPLYNTLKASGPQTDLIKGMDNLDKDTVAIIGTTISGTTGLAGALFPEISIPMALYGAVGTGVSIKSSLMQDKSSRQIIGDGSLASAQLLWTDPAAKKIMTNEVKGVLREAFGVDFGAPISEHRKHLPEEMKNYIDVYLDSKGLSPEQIQAREEATIKSITTSMNNSLDAAVGKIISDMKAQQQEAQTLQIKKQYYDGEIRGGVYLVGILAEHFMSPKGAKVVNAIANSAVQMDMMITALSMGALGPVGMAAGCVLIALNLLGVFGSSGPSAEQLIMEAVGKVQESIYALHKEMRELFGIVIENQQKMMQRIDSQFELLKTKQDDALRQLQEIRDELKMIMNQNRVRGRNEQTAELDRKIQSMNTQINKKLNGAAVIEENKIEELIEECHVYAIKTSKYDDFTSLPNPDEAILQWDAANIINILKTADLVDHFVGMIPLILKRYAPQQNIGVINNPKALGRAAMAMSVAYCSFPKTAKTYEKNRLHFIKDISQLITETKKSLFTAVNAETIKSFKTSYLSIVSKILDESLKAGEEATCRNNNFKPENGLFLLVNGPIGEISFTAVEAAADVKNKSSFSDHSIMEKDVLSRDNTVRQTMNVPHPDFYPTLKNITWQGIDNKDPDRLFTTDEVFALLGKLNIITIEQGVAYLQPIVIKSRDGINEGPYAGAYNYDYSAQENSVANKITFNRVNGDIIIIGDAIKSGWIQSKISKEKFVLDIPLPLPEDQKHGESVGEKNIEYISNDQLTNSFVNGSSVNFLTKLKDEVNNLLKLKSQLIDNTNKIILDDKNVLSLEFEAASVCLKYLAGMSIYIRTGNAELATSVSKDQIVGINAFMEQTADGNIAVQQNANTLLSNRRDIAALISKITSSDYLKNSAYLKSVGDTNITLKEYIKKEVIIAADKMIDEYTSYYFSGKSDRFSLPELTIAQVMLAAAEKSVKAAK